MPPNQLIEAFRHLLKEETTILAAPEDVAYFRSLYRNTLKDRESGKEAISYQNQSIVPQEPQVSKTPLIAGGSGEDLSSALKPKEAMIPKPADHSEIKPKIAEQVHTKAAVQKDPSVKKELPAALRGIESPSFSTMKTLLAKIAPELAIFDTIPSDATAKKIATRWKTKNQSAPISVLSGNELPQYKKFLEEIAAALDTCFGSARIVQADPIEKEKQWEPFLASEGLKLIVVCDATLWQLQNLRQFYKETPTQGIRTLGKIPLCLLPDLSLYFKDPLLKRSLWKALCLKCS